MRSLSIRVLIALSILLVPTFAFANVTVSGTTTGGGGTPGLSGQARVLSTRAAIVDACSGNKGMEGCMCSRKVRSIQSRALQACALRGRGPLRSRRRIRTMAPAINPTIATPAARTAVITAML